MRDTILYDSALRLFGDHVSRQVLDAAETLSRTQRSASGSVNCTWPSPPVDFFQPSGTLTVMPRSLYFFTPS